MHPRSCACIKFSFRIPLTVIFFLSSCFLPFYPLFLHLPSHFNCTQEFRCLTTIPRITIFNCTQEFRCITTIPRITTFNGTQELRCLTTTPRITTFNCTQELRCLTTIRRITIFNYNKIKIFKATVRTRKRAET